MDGWLYLPVGRLACMPVCLCACVYVWMDRLHLLDWVVCLAFAMGLPVIVCITVHNYPACFISMDLGCRFEGPPSDMGLLVIVCIIVHN